MYQNHDMKKKVPQDAPRDQTLGLNGPAEGWPGDVGYPSADKGKLQMYKAAAGTPYSKGYASQKRLDVGAGMPPGSESNKGAYDPTIPVRLGGPHGGKSGARGGK